MTTTLADLRLAAQQRCDRVNAPVPQVGEWNTYINGSAGSLYRILTSTYEDYNVKTTTFTLAGGIGANTLTVGFGSTVADFDKIRKLSYVYGTEYLPVYRANSLLEFDALTSPVISGYAGPVAGLRYALYGPTLEVRPAACSAGTYQLYYVPAFQKLVADSDSIDGTWMATSGIEEYIVLDAAAKAMVREESLDTANLLMQQRELVKAEILGQFAQRDDNQPGRIVDTGKWGRRRAWGGWGWP